jgi:putative ABC transport system permease protein
MLDRVGIFYVIGRTGPGLDAAAVRAEVDQLEARLDAADAGRLKWGARAVAIPFLDHVFGPVRPALRVLWAAVAVLLLIACANVSGLMMTRISRRRQVDGIRLALGATRAAVGRVWLAETAILAVAGGLVGLLLAQWLAFVIVALAPDDLPRIGEIAIDGRVALFTFVVVVLVALIAGLLPLRHAGATSLLAALDGQRATASRATLRARAALLVVQIGLAVVLLIGAGLVLRSFIALQRIDLGFGPDGVLSLTVQPRNANRPANEWLRDFLRRVRTLPGVESAGAVYLRPLMLGPIGQGARVVLEGQPQTPQSADLNPTLNYQVATPGYFETLGITLLAGRPFTDQDTAKTPRVAIVSQSTARRLWPGQDPIGKRVSMSAFTPGTPGQVWRTVVGVVTDVRYRGLQDVQFDVYDAALQAGLPADNVVVRVTGDPLALVSSVRAIAREMDPTAVVDGTTTLEAVVSRAQAPWRLTMWMFVLFAALAFGLALLGLFSLVALDVAQRGREFAIRLALGASRGEVVRGVLARAGWVVATGLAVGMAGAFVAGRAIGSLLFGVAPGDALTYLLVLLAVGLAVGGAAWLPARRAARADPQALLRQG